MLFRSQLRSQASAPAPVLADGLALLAALQAQRPGWQPQRLLDAGCGTGQGAQLLQAAYPATQLLRLDFAPAMLACAAPGAPLCADLEALPLAPACIDLYWSSMAVQWCDLGRVLQEAARVLAHPRARHLRRARPGRCPGRRGPAPPGLCRP